MQLCILLYIIVLLTITVFMVLITVSKHIFKLIFVTRNMCNDYIKKKTKHLFLNIEILLKIQYFISACKITYLNVTVINVTEAY